MRVTREEILLRVIRVLNNEVVCPENMDEETLLKDFDVVPRDDNHKKQIEVYLQTHEKLDFVSGICASHENV